MAWPHIWIGNDAAILRAELPSAFVVFDDDVFVVNLFMVMPAQQNEVIEICLPSMFPILNMVNLARRIGLIAPRESTCSIPGDNRSGLSRSAYLIFSTDVKNL